MSSGMADFPNGDTGPTRRDFANTQNAYADQIAQKETLRGIQEEKAKANDAVENASFGLVNLKLGRQGSTWRLGDKLRKQKTVSLFPRMLFFPYDKFKERRKQSNAINPEGEAEGKKKDKESDADKRSRKWEDRRYFGGLIDAIVSLVVVPGRLGFGFDPWQSDAARIDFTMDVSILTAIELLLWPFRVWNFVILLQSYQQNHPLFLVRSVFSSKRNMSRKVQPASERRVRSSIGRRSSNEEVAKRQFTAPLNVAKQRTSLRSSMQQPSTKVVLGSFLSCVPFDLLFILMQEYNLTHVAGFFRLVMATHFLPYFYHVGFLQAYRGTKLVHAMSFSTTALLVNLVWIGIYLCHIAASGYMFIAHFECGIDFAICNNADDAIHGSWVTKDQLHYGSPWRKYIRTIYWAAKTITTLGQGDLVPANQLETVYCLFVQLCSGLWTTAMLSACGFYFSRRNPNLSSSVSTHLDQSVKFMIARDVPKDIAAHVRYYFQYIQTARQGFDEKRVLDDLPARYHLKCNNHIKYNIIKRVPMFRKQSGPFLHVVMDTMEVDFFSPKQTALALGSIQRLLMVTKGELRVTSSKGEFVAQLLAGSSFGEDALFSYTYSTSQIIAEAACECWWMSKRNFDLMLRKYFPRTSMVRLRAHYRANNGDEHDSQVVAGKPKSGKGRNKSNKSNAGSVSCNAKQGLALRKLMENLEQDSMNALKSVHPWRFPNSKFATTWRLLDCLALLYTAIEVPYQIAFLRGFNLFAPIGTPNTSQHNPGTLAFVLMCLTVLVEMFSYVNWALRALWFVRSMNGSVDASQSTSQSQNLIYKRKAIIQHYLENDRYILDIISHLPIALCWDFVNKIGMSDRVIRFMGLFRLFRLLRTNRLPFALRRIMVEKKLGASTRLLLRLFILCLILLNGAGAIFYIMSDRDGYVDGIPATPEGQEAIRSLASFGSLSDINTECLALASLHNNCTWFIRDKFVYQIDSPFIRAMHWSVVMISTVGYGDIIPLTQEECLLAFIWIYIGALLCYTAAGAISSVLAQWNALNRLKKDRLLQINRALMSSGSIPSDVAGMIGRYYSAKWTINGSCVNEDEILAQLPQSLRKEVQKNLYYELLGRCAMFNEAPRRHILLFELSTCVHCEVYLKGMPITSAGHLASDMFVVQAGVVELSTQLELAQQNKPSKRNSDQLLSPVSFTYPPQNRPSPPLVKSERSGSTISRLRQLRRLSTAKEKLLESQWLSQLPVRRVVEHQWFGEESLATKESVTYELNAVAVENARIIVLPREEFLTMVQRFPEEMKPVVETIELQRTFDENMLVRIKSNLTSKKKLFKVLGKTNRLLSGIAPFVKTRQQSALGETSDYILDPFGWTAKVWSWLMYLVLAYNFYMTPIRLAFLHEPSEEMESMFVVSDIASDVILLLDAYLAWNHIGYKQFGNGSVLNRPLIRARYKTRRLRYDAASLLPLDYLGESFFLRSVGRLPRMIKSPQLLEFLRGVEDVLQEKFLSKSLVFLSMFDLVRFLIFFLSAAHQIGSAFFLIGRLSVQSGYATRSWMTIDPVLNENPNDVGIAYLRSIYWSLETFTVVCFGDIVAQNPIETIFCSLICLLGWIFIGQVIMEMTTVMQKMDLDAKILAELMNDFKEYAKRRALPGHLTKRAQEGIEFSARSLVETQARAIFADLPDILRAQFFECLYVDIPSQVPELKDACSRSQLEAIVNALEMTLYLRKDIIFQEGRIGSKLFFIKDGQGEMMSANSGMVYATVYEGAMIGDLAFFLHGTTHLATARAIRSCQILELSRQKWNTLWPAKVRNALEMQLMIAMKRKYRRTVWVYANVLKNLKPESQSSQQNRQTEIKSGKKQESQTDYKRNRSKSRVGDMIGSLINQTSKTGQTRTFARSNNKLKRMLFESYKGQSGFNSAGPTKAGIKRGPSLTLISNAVRSTTAVGATSPKSANSAMSFMTKIRNTAKVSPSASKNEKYPSVQRSLRESLRHSIVSTGRRASLTVVSAGMTAKSMLWQRHAENLRLLKSLEHYNHANGEQVSRQANMNGNGQRPLSSTSLRRDESRRASMSIVPSLNDQGLSTVEQNEKKYAQEVAKMTIDAGTQRQSDLKTHAFLTGIRVTSLGRSQNIECIRDFRLRMDATRTKTARNLESGTNAPSVKAKTEASSENGLKTLMATFQLKRLLKNKLNNKRAVAPVVEQPTPSAITHQPETKRRASAILSSYDSWIDKSESATFSVDQSTFRRLWDAIMLIVCIYYVIVIPFRVSFDFDALEVVSVPLATTIWFSCEYVGDVLCAIDFILHRSYFSFMHRGEIVTNSEEIRDHYFYKGSYLVDLFTLLPLELLGYITAPTSKNDSWTLSTPTWYYISVLRLNKMLRFIHLRSLGDRVHQSLVYDLRIWSSSPTMIAFTHSVFGFLLGAYWIACIFYGISFRVLREYPDISSWLTTPGMLSFTPISGIDGVYSVPISGRITRSLHFSLGAITTISYGDIAPKNGIETLVTTIIIILSIGFFGMLSGSFFQVYEAELGQRADYEERVARVASYLQRHNFDAEIWKQLRLYFAVHWQQSKGMNEAEQLRGLTMAGTQDVTFFVLRDLIRGMPLFSHCDEGFIRAVLAAFEQELYVQGDVIIRQGETCKSLFVIENGAVSVRITKRVRKMNSGSVVSGVRNRRRISAIVTKQTQADDMDDAAGNEDMEEKTVEFIRGRCDFLGEKSLLFDIPRTATCVALGTCTMLRLTVEKYEEILQSFPEYRERNQKEWIFLQRKGRGTT